MENELQQNFTPEKFRFVLIEGICMGEIKRSRNMMGYFYEKVLWEKEKCCLSAFSPFSTMFLKAFPLTHVKSLDCVEQVNF